MQVTRVDEGAPRPQLHNNCGRRRAATGGGLETVETLPYFHHLPAHHVRLFKTSAAAGALPHAKPHLGRALGWLPGVGAYGPADLPPPGGRPERGTGTLPPAAEQASAAAGARLASCLQCRNRSVPELQASWTIPRVLQAGRWAHLSVPSKCRHVQRGGPLNVLGVHVALQAGGRGRQSGRQACRLRQGQVVCWWELHWVKQ